MAEIEGETHFGHCFEQGTPVIRQWTRVVCAPTEARTGPGRANHAQAGLPPFIQFSWVAYAFGSFHQRDQTNRVRGAAGIAPMGQDGLQVCAGADELKIVGGLICQFVVRVQLVAVNAVGLVIVGVDLVIPIAGLAAQGCGE